MRTLLGCALVLGLGLSAAGRPDDKDDAKKLVGKWEPKEAKEGFKSVLEFTADGKVTISGTRKDKDFKVEGTYKLDGKKLTWTVKPEGKEERKEELTVTKLADDELGFEDSKGNKRDYKRVKGSGKDK